MKKMKRAAVVVLALAMLFALGIPAMAAGETYSITINNETKGHTYEAYQIFKGDLAKPANPDEADGTTAVLSNIEWGSGVKSTDTAGIQGALSAASAAEIAQRMSAGYEPVEGKPAITMTDLLNEVKDHLAGPTAESVYNTTNYTISGLEPGYYLVKDKDGSLNNANDAMTNFILEVVENSTVKPKSSVPTIVKKVQDTNDSTAVSSGWQDSADYDIGDKVPYQITVTLPNNIESYSKYELTVVDNLSKGLTYNNETAAPVITLNGVTMTAGHGIDSGVNPDGSTTVKFNFTDLIHDGAKNTNVIVITYFAELNENAALGVHGNPNDVYMKYSNNPNGEGLGQSPKDLVTVFTYQLLVHKTDEKNDPLTGAEFTLFKKQSDGSLKQIGEPVSGPDKTAFHWKGIDDGDYVLKETKTPVGYNTVDPIEFTVTATHDAESDNPQLTVLSGGDKFTGMVEDGSVVTTVVNKAGSTLPETGGMGVTPLYILGGAILLAAVVVIVERKRAKA